LAQFVLKVELEFVREPLSPAHRNEGWLVKSHRLVVSHLIMYVIVITLKFIPLHWSPPWKHGGVDLMK
jgi:hypothetical protein